MVDFNSFLGAKYNILQQQADTARAAQQSTAGYQKALGSAIPADIARTQAQTNQINLLAPIQAEQANEEYKNTAATGVYGFSAAPDAIVRRVGAGLLGQERAMGYGGSSFSATRGMPLGYGQKGADEALPADDNRDRANPAYNQNTARGIYIGGQKRGLTKVPGKGDGTQDTVAAKLAPGEAVLNKPAAEHMGRGMIAALNALGAQKMGMPPGDGAGPGFAAGTEDVMTPEAQARAAYAQHFRDWTNRVQGWTDADAAQSGDTASPKVSHLGFVMPSQAAIPKTYRLPPAEPK